MSGPPRRPARRSRRRRPAPLAVVGLAVVSACWSGRAGDGARGPSVPVRVAGRTVERPPDRSAARSPEPAPPARVSPVGDGTGPPGAPPVAAAAPVRPYPLAGLLTFRGNATRTYYGEGPVPVRPKVLWRFPDAPMCSESSTEGETSRWCGTGWTGQPAVFERDGRTWVVFGAYDRRIHFVDGGTGERLLPDFVTGDLVKGSVTVDPDGFPLLYAGSRDGRYRILALDRERPTELWSLAATAVRPILWNNDWDSSGLVVGDHLLEGGENSQWHVVRLGRSVGPDGRVRVDPRLVFHAPGWDDQLLAELGDRDVSIEGSIAVSRGVAYFANSGGLVQGWDVSGLEEGRAPTRVFRFWTGDDTDATVVVDDQGMLYVASEWDRRTERARQVGQVLKLDPRRPDPVVWSLADQAEEGAGVWATPAIHRDLVVVATHGGRLLGLDRATGAVRWERRLPGPTWQSPVVVDDVLLMGDCQGRLHAYDVSDTRVEPPELWSVPVGGCVESTPAVWGGRIYVGTRLGYVVALGHPDPSDG